MHSLLVTFTHLIGGMGLDPHVIHRAPTLQLSSQEHNVGIISPDCIIILSGKTNLSQKFKKQLVHWNQVGSVSDSRGFYSIFNRFVTR